MTALKYIFFFLCSAFFYSCTQSVITPIYPVPGASDKVLVEMFTNYRCPYCPPGNSYLDSIYSNLGKTITDTNVVILRYHTTLYPNDPFYDYNVPDNNARQTYYSAHNANPRGFLMGSAMGVFSSPGWTSQINNNLGVTAKFRITLANTYNTSSRSGSINISITQDSGNTVADLKLHTALTESGIMYTAPNGETVFNNTMRDLITAPAGDSITINAGGSISRDYNYTVANDITHQNCELVIFIQSESTKQIFAVNKVKLF